MTDTLPAGLTATAISGGGWSCMLGTLTCTRSDVPGQPVDSYPDITLTVDVANNAAALGHQLGHRLWRRRPDPGNR